MKWKLAASLLACFFALVSSRAYAGLIDVGTTVQVFFYNGQFAGPAGLIPDGALTSDPIALTGPRAFTNNVSGVDINVGDVRIVLTNRTPNAPFCVLNNVGTACTDEIDGFDFRFTGANILGVSADASSAVGFLPVTGTFGGHTHLGLQLLSNNEIRVDLTGDLPNSGDQLILDLSFSTSPVPGPIAGAGVPGLVLTFGGLIAWTRRRNSQGIAA